MARTRTLLCTPTALLCCAALLLVAGTGHALTFSVGASDSGWYDDTGAHTASNENYVAGYDGFGELRNFFTFDLAGSVPASETVLSATLRLYNPDVGEPDVTYTGGYDSPDPSETYQVHEVTTPAAVITLGGVGLTPTYDDLGDGPVWGSVSVSSADNGSFVEITLSAAALAAIESNIDLAAGDFVLGGLLTSYSGQTSLEEAVFAHTDPPGHPTFPRELVVVTTPEPGTGLMLALGMMGLGATRRRRAARRG